MYLSQYFLPTLKENPKEAAIKSHQLMLRAGLIRQEVSGIYTWLPMGLTVLRNIENIIRTHLNKIGCLEVLMPTIQPASLWIESNRYDSYGKEMLKIKDRHDVDLLYGPTCEEVITDIFRREIKSYKDLPKNFYQINWKFRDEIRPRFGVMRGREFLMLDNYSFDLNEESAKKTYDKIYQAFFDIFKAMDLNSIAVRAETGAIGGNLSHEFHILADTGESEIFYDKKFDDLIKKDQLDINTMQNTYAMADDMHQEDQCPIKKDQIISKRGIEIGHIFNFSTKYSKALNAKLLDKNGQEFYPNMGSYGIGVSRLVGAIIESSHDENGIIWPNAIAPFDATIINLKPKDEQAIKITEDLKQKLQKKNIKILVDDTDQSAGQKFFRADLIGIPKQIVIGNKTIKENIAEVKNRHSNEKQQLTLDQIINS